MCSILSRVLSTLLFPVFRAGTVPMCPPIYRRAQWARKSPSCPTGVGTKWFLVTLQVTALAVVGTSGHDLELFLPTTRSFRGVGGHEIAPRLGDRLGVRQQGEAVAFTARRGTRVADDCRFDEPFTQRVECVEQPPAPLVAELVTRHVPNLSGGQRLPNMAQHIPNRGVQHLYPPVAVEPFREHHRRFRRAEQLRRHPG